MAAVAIPLMLIGGAMGAIGSYNQGKAAYQMSIYNAGELEKNAVAAKQQAAEEERRQRAMGGRTLGNIRASYGASGLSSDGTGQDILEESASLAELDALTIRHSGVVAAENYKNQARMTRFQGSEAFRAAKLGAWTSIFTAGAQAASFGGNMGKGSSDEPQIKKAGSSGALGSWGAPSSSLRRTA